MSDSLTNTAPNTTEIFYGTGLSERKGNNFLYVGLLVYLMMFYSQFAGRYPVFAPLRLELLLGSVLVLLSLLRVLGSGFRENRLNLAAVLFILVAVINIPFALVRGRALDMFIHMIKFFAVYFMIVAAIDEERKLKGFIYIYLSMIALIFVEPFILSLRGEGFMYNNHMWRLRGVTNYFGHPNQLGGITAENLPFFFYLMQYEKSKARKILLFGLILVAIRVVMLTQSRTGFITVCVFGLLVLLFSRHKLRSFFILVVACLALWQVAPPQTKERFLTMANMGKVITTEEVDFSKEETAQLGSMASRWELLRRGVLVFLDDPIIGVGLNCYRSANFQRWNYYFPPHNTYIQALSEMGLVGFGAFVFVLVTILRNLRDSKKALQALDIPDSFLSYMNKAVMMYILLRMVVGMFGQDLYENFWWIAGGLSVVLLRVSRLKQQHAAGSEKAV